MRAAISFLFVAGCTTSAVAAADLPSRGEVQVAVDHWVNGCWELARSDPNLDCVPIAPRQVRSVRCRAEEAADRAPRVLCRFSGVALLSGGRRPRFGPDCAYLGRSGQGAWGIVSFPGADLCAF